MWQTIKRYWRGIRRWGFGDTPSDRELSDLLREVMRGRDRPANEMPGAAGAHCCIITFDDNGETWCSPTVPDGDACAALKDRIERQYGRTASQNFFDGARCPSSCERIIR